MPVQEAHRTVQRPANGGQMTETPNETAGALVRVLSGKSPCTGRCGHCGKALSRQGARWCSDKCRMRAARGLPVETAKPKAWAVPLVHAAYSIEPCPVCGFPEADGGHCEACGWTATDSIYPEGSCVGPRYDRRGERIERTPPEAIGTVTSSCRVTPLGARRAA